MPSLRSVACVLFAIASAVGARADRIELADGSVIVGKLVSAEAGKFTVETGFAGKIEIEQNKIKGFTTDEPVNVGLSAGSAVLGRVELADAGIKVVAADGQMSAATGNVAAIWRVGADSPDMRAAKAALEKAKRKWAFEASVAINGRTGATEKFGANLGFVATLASAQDKLVFNLSAERAEDNGVSTADRQAGGADYSAFFSDKNVWYARTALEKDKIKALDLRSTTAFGLGRKLIKKEKQDLEVRFGVSYLYETFANNTKFDSPGADLAILHSYQFANVTMANQLNYTPAFEDFANYRLHHESSIQLPLGASLWRLKFGVANDFLSEPPPGTDKFDTTYYTSLILNWQ